MTDANVVFAGPAGHEPFKQEAKPATDETILPGHLVLIDSDGEMSNHDSEGQGGNYGVADINYYLQKGIGDVIPVGQTSDVFIPAAGEYYNVRVGASQTIVKGTALASAGDGTVKAATTTGATPDVVLMYAEEALTTGAGESGRIRARVATAGFGATA